MKRTMTSGLLAVAVASAMAPAHAQRSAFDRMLSDLMYSGSMPQGSDAEAANDPRSEIRVPFIRPNLNQRGQGLRIVDTGSHGVMDIEPVAVQRYMRRHAMSPDSSHLMKDVPGVEVTGPGWVSGLPVIHGMAGPRLRLVVDGTDLQGAYGPWLNPVLTHVNPARLARLRVYPGVAPVSMGGRQYWWRRGAGIRAAAVCHVGRQAVALG